MNQSQFDPTPNNQLLSAIHKGMHVVDREGKHIGTVEFIQMGVENVSGAGAADLPRTPERRPSFMEDIARAIAPEDQLPDTVQNRLLFNGFVRLDSSMLFHADRYILPDQIDTISGDQVVLNVAYDDLVKSD
ncbi:MAG TPA: hypothetical protein VHO48_01930 [Anaerolineaceae bacterium]|nr:hypothetical protein [Anaerolineaceae bacterium]